ncbi:MAG: twin-arginine translocation signal domain-containing protein, partial [Thermodesulfobacteriota bacterium]
MGNSGKGISRRQFLTTSAAIGLGGLLSKKVFGKSKESGPPK